MAEIEVTDTLLDDVKDFIAEKWKHSQCELCGTDRWGIGTEPFSNTYLPVAGDAGLPKNYPPDSLIFMPLFCLNCGNLRLVWKGIFQKWREEQRARTTKSSD